MKTDTGKIPYSIKEIYCIVYYGMRSVPHLSKARRKNELSHESIERIMLAVTEVNGCAICSYAHAKIALAGGMGQEEIQNMESHCRHLWDVESLRYSWCDSGHHDRQCLWHSMEFADEPVQGKTGQAMFMVL